MKEKQTVKGTYHVNGVEREFEIAYKNEPKNEEDNNRLFEMLDRPWSLIKQGGELGVNGVKRFFTVLFLFGMVNAGLFFYAMYSLFTDFAMGKMFYVALVFIAGVAITIFACYQAYQYVVVDALRVIYENLESLFQKMSAMIVDKTEDIFGGKVDVADKQFKKAMNYGNMLSENYESMPGFLRNGVAFILGKIPLVGMLMDLREDILQGNKMEASSQLYEKMDGFISGNVFEGNNTNWMFWAIPLNILLVLAFIHYMIA